MKRKGRVGVDEGGHLSKAIRALSSCAQDLTLFESALIEGSANLMNASIALNASGPAIPEGVWSHVIGHRQAVNQMLAVTRSDIEKIENFIALINGWLTGEG